MSKQFFYLLRTAIGTGPFFERPRTSDEWRALYRLSMVHGVTAVVFDFVRQLRKSEAPDRALLMQWLSAAAGVEQTMRRMQMAAENHSSARVRWGASSLGKDFTKLKVTAVTPCCLLIR